MYKISLLTGQPQYDSLPVAKILDYPLEERDYKPFAQAIAAISPLGLHLRLWAFEALPSPLSSLEAVISLTPGMSSRYLSVSLFADGNRHFRILEDGNAQSFEEAGLKEPSVRLFDGEDLQGIYWGGEVLFDSSLLEEIYGPLSLASGQSLRGNFYKLSRDPERPHWGSLYPARFPNDPYGEDSMGSFLLIDY